MAMMEFAAEDYKIDHKLAGVGAGLGGGFINTNELKVMKYKEAIEKIRNAGLKQWTKSTTEWPKTMCGSRSR